MEPIGVRLVKAEKKGRKITVVFESDLFSEEQFAVTPYYSEGEKDQLQAIIFSLEVVEKSGKVEAKVNFGNPLSHFTKGHTQIHFPINTLFKDRKDSVLNWAYNAEMKQFYEDQINRVLSQFKDEHLFCENIREIIKDRFKQQHSIKVLLAKKELDEAIVKLQELLA